MRNLFKAMELMDAAKLNANQTLLLVTLMVQLNKNFWKPAPISGETAGRGMSKNTFLKVRKSLLTDGWIVMRPGQWKTAQPVYDLGPRFDNDKPSTCKKMRSPDEIKKLVIEIDQQYPDFSGLCLLHKWDKAIEILKASHPELQLNQWAVDSIGDPLNRKQAHEMFVKLHARKGGPVVSTVKLSAPESPWASFHLFVDMWLLSYPKKASKVSVRAAVKEFISDKGQWTPAQVKELQDKIEVHTKAYVTSFGDDIKYMVSPVNYFASEKWTEKVPVKNDKTDINYKTAGAPVRPNMPSVTTIKAN